MLLYNRSRTWDFSLRQLLLKDYRDLQLVDAHPVPLVPGEIRVAVRAVGICGSDVHGFLGVNSRRSPGMVMGHEASGVVLELGPGVNRPAVGTPVAINPLLSCGTCEACRSGHVNVCPQMRLYGCVPSLPGAFADSIVVRAANAVPFEGPAPLELAALAEPLAVGNHAVRAASVDREHAVLVVGGGPIGIGAALSAARHGARRVVVSEPQEHRRALIARLGLEAVAPDDVPSASFDVAFDCFGRQSTLTASLEAVVLRGRVVLIGLAEELVPLAVTPVIAGERTLTGSMCYSPEDFDDVSAWVASGSVDLAPMIESRVDFPGLVRAFAEYAEGSRSALKTLLELP